ncbi:MAG: glycosyl hydrolase [Nocardioides sp.]
MLPPFRRFLAILAAMMVMAVTHPTQATAAPPKAPPAPAAPQTPYFGVSLEHAPWDMSELETLASSLDRRPTQVMWYDAWSSGTGFPAQQASAVAAFGATPVITWEPWNPAGGVDQPAFALDTITAGRHDDYLTMWAKQVRAYSKPVVLRFAHEMNGSWYPWAAGINGNTAADYVAAWKHVAGLFARQRVKNVTWSWSPNVPYPGSTPLASLYPGDSTVGIVALDGYNWAGLLPGSSWTSFRDVFAQGQQELAALTSKPVSIGEVGAPEVGGDKGQWVRDMFTYLATQPNIAGFTWFSHLKEADWRINSSETSLAAFRDGLATY